MVDRMSRRQPRCRPGLEAGRTEPGRFRRRRSRSVVESSRRDLKPALVAQSLGVELTPVSVRDTDEMARNAAIFACSANGGVIVTAGGTSVHRELIIRLAAKKFWTLPAFISASSMDILHQVAHRSK